METGQPQPLDQTLERQRARSVAARRPDLRRRQRLRELSTRAASRSRQRLLNYADKEADCYPCHNGNVAARNVEAEFSKPSIHPVMKSTGLHDPMEANSLPAGSRHVECQDCHNPHASTATTGKTPGGVSGALNGVRGVNSAGANIPQVTFEYELCFRCHAETATGPAHVDRPVPAVEHAA